MFIYANRYGDIYGIYDDLDVMKETILSRSTGDDEKFKIYKVELLEEVTTIVKLEKVTEES